MENKSDAHQFIEVLIKNSIRSRGVYISPVQTDAIIEQIITNLFDEENLWAISEFLAETVNERLPDIPLSPRWDEDIWGRR